MTRFLLTLAAAVAFASTAYGSARVRFVLGPFERIVDEGPFDQIYCLEVLEHLYEEQAVETLRLFARAAAPAAQLLVTTPNAHSAWPLIEAGSASRIEPIAGTAVSSPTSKTVRAVPGRNSMPP